MARFDYVLTACVALILAGHFTMPRVVPTVATTSTPSSSETVQPSGNVLAKLKQAERLYTVGNSILLANADLCGEKVAPWYGFYGGDMYLYEGDWRDALMAAYGLGEQPTVLADVVVSPLYQAGIRRGDIIKAVNGQATRSGRNATSHMLALLQQASRGGLTELTFERQGQLKTVRIPTKYRCDYNIIFEDSDLLNTYTDGNNIVLSSGMIAFASRDEELALVFAHELSHNAIQMKQNADALLGPEVSGFLSDAAEFVGDMISRESMASTGQPRSGYGPDEEQEADYLTMYLLARAGIRTKPELAEFWGRIAETGPRAVDPRFAHPNFATRRQVIRKTISEITAKRQRGQSLTPAETAP